MQVALQDVSAAYSPQLISTDLDTNALLQKLGHYLERNCDFFIGKNKLTPNHLRYNYAAQVWFELKHIVTIDSEVPKLKSFQPAEAVLSRLDVALGGSKASLCQKLIAYLSLNWQRVRGTLCCYTAMPDGEVTEVFIRLAEYLEAPEVNKSADTCALVRLMPGVKIESEMEVSGHCILANLPLSVVLKQHVLDTANFNYLIHVSCVSVLSQPAAWSCCNLANPYFDALSHTGSAKDAFYNRADVDRLAQHSCLLENIFALKNKLDDLGQSNNLYDRIEQLASNMYFSSARGVGSEFRAGERVYATLVEFLEYWHALKATDCFTENRYLIPKTEQFLDNKLASNLKTYRCIDVVRAHLLAAAKSEQEHLLAISLSVDDEHGVAVELRSQLDDEIAKLPIAVHEQVQREVVLAHSNSDYAGCDKLGMPYSVVRAFGSCLTELSLPFFIDIINNSSANEMGQFIQDKEQSFVGVFRSEGSFIDIFSWVRPAKLDLFLQRWPQAGHKIIFPAQGNMSSSGWLYVLPCFMGGLLQVLAQFRNETSRSFFKHIIFSFVLALKCFKRDSYLYCNIINKMRDLLRFEFYSEAIDLRVLIEKRGFDFSFNDRHLVAADSQRTGFVRGISFLMLLASFPEGVGLLTVIFDKNPSLAGSINMIELVKGYQTDVQYSMGSCALHGLCAYGGHVILNQLASANSRFFEEMDVNSLLVCERESHRFFAQPAQSPLFYLCTNILHRPFLLQLVQSNPGFVQWLKTEMTLRLQAYISQRRDPGQNNFRFDAWKGSKLKVVAKLQDWLAHRPDEAAPALSFKEKQHLTQGRMGNSVFYSGLFSALTRHFAGQTRPEVQLSANQSRPEVQLSANQSRPGAQVSMSRLN